MKKKDVGSSPTAHLGVYSLKVELKQKMCLVESIYMGVWRNGNVSDCESLNSGSIPDSPSK